MLDNVEKNIQRIESLIYFIYKKIDLYDPQYFSKDNEDCSLQYSHIIGEFFQCKNHTSLCMSLNSTVHPLMINDISWKVVLIQYLRIIWRHFHHLEMNSYLHKKNTLKDCHIMYPMKQKDICDYDPICIISSGLMFDDIIIDITRKNKLAHLTKENDCLFTQIENNINWKKELTSV